MNKNSRSSSGQNLMHKVLIAAFALLLGNQSFANSMENTLDQLNIKSIDLVSRAKVPGTEGFLRGKETDVDSNFVLPVTLVLSQQGGAQIEVQGQMVPRHSGFLMMAAGNHQASRFYNWSANTLQDFEGLYYGVSMGQALLFGGGVRALTNGAVSLVSANLYAGNGILLANTAATLELDIPAELMHAKLIYSK